MVTSVQGVETRERKEILILLGASRVAVDLCACCLPFSITPLNSYLRSNSIICEYSSGKGCTMGTL